MNRAGSTVMTWVSVIFLLSTPNFTSAQDARGSAGLPSYIKSPADRTSLCGDRTDDRRAESDGERHSGHGFAEGFGDRHQREGGHEGERLLLRVPEVPGGDLVRGDEGVQERVSDETPVQGHGVGRVHHVRGRPGHRNGPGLLEPVPESWTVDVSCDQIMVKTGEKSEPAAWDNPDSSYTNSYDLRMLNLGTASPR